jgi:hypothetical protein
LRPSTAGQGTSAKQTRLFSFEADVKSYLDEALRRGMGGEPGAMTALHGFVASDLRESAGAFCENSLTMRAAVATPRSLRLKNTAHGVAIDVSGYLPVGVT